MSWPSLSQVMRTKAAKAAIAYWIGVVLVFLGVQAAGFDMIADGAIPVALLTAPASLLAMMAIGSLSYAPSEAWMLRPLNSPVGVFLILPVLCGGLNAVLIFTLWSAVQRRRYPRR